MPTPRKQQLDLSATPYYHCITRCVRRAFLCGRDELTGKNFDHRKGWLVSRMKWLAELFAIDICAYAVMSNHYHLVLRVDKERALSWSNLEVVNRWLKLFPKSSAQPLGDLKLSEHDLGKHADKIQVWREQLYSISWFMRAMNEWIARLANTEDDRSGRFWESRFKSQGLLDEAAVLACMVYVDLNPIRAGVAQTPEDSDYTSIQERIAAFQLNQQPRQLVRLGSSGNDTGSDKSIPIELETYIDLVDTSGRVVREDKHGSIPDKLVPILERLNLEPSHWVNTVRQFSLLFTTFIGSPDSLINLRPLRRRIKGFRQSKKVFRSNVSDVA